MDERYENQRKNYYGLYYEERNRREEVERQLIRLKQLYGEQQTLIIGQSDLISSLRKGVCHDHTQVTYMLKPLLALETEYTDGV